MKLTQNKAEFDQWAESHRLNKAIFRWKTPRGWESECCLYDKTFNEALEIAKAYGYVEFKWYKPRTWGNGFITVGY